MKNYSTIEVNKRTHVVCVVDDRNGLQMPNYMNTGMALCGVVKKGDSFEDWKMKHKK